MIGVPNAMSPLDSAFLRLETPGTSMHIASVAIFDGPTPSYVEVCNAIRAKLADVPRFRQRVREVPLRLGAPIWVEDPRFDLTYHVRHTALPTPGASDQLDALVSRLISQRLERDRPLWEIWLVEGLTGGKWALVSKVHHCMVDGIAGTGLLHAIFDAQPEAPAAARRVLRPAEVEPSRVQMLTSVVRGWPQYPVNIASGLVGALRHPRQATRSAAIRLHGLVDYAELVRPAARSTLTGPLRPARTWRRARVELADVRTVRSTFGGSVNDVLLAAVTSGFRDLLLSRDGVADPRAVRALIPVSVRMPGNQGQPDNQISAVVADLPIDIEDDLARLHAVRAELDHLKVSGEAQAGELLNRLAAFVPAPLLAAGLSVGFRAPQRFITTVVTNVPGPTQPLYFAGRRLRELYPIVPIADRLRIGVAISSYCGVLFIGITADRDRGPDLTTLIAGVEHAITDLVERCHDSIADAADVVAVDAVAAGGG